MEIGRHQYLAEHKLKLHYPVRTDCMWRLLQHHNPKLLWHHLCHFLRWSLGHKVGVVTHFQVLPYFFWPVVTSWCRGGTTTAAGPHPKELFSWAGGAELRLATPLSCSPPHLGRPRHISPWNMIQSNTNMFALEAKHFVMFSVLPVPLSLSKLL